MKRVGQDRRSRPKARPPNGDVGVVLFWGVLAALGLTAVGLAGWGWIIESASPVAIKANSPVTASTYDGLDFAIRSIKVLLLSDIYFDPIHDPGAKWRLEIARLLGIGFSLLLAGRLVLFAFSARTSELMLRFRRGHDVLVGSGRFATGFADAEASQNVNHLTGESVPNGAYARLRRRGTLEQQLKSAGVAGARRILVDEGDDADTWQTAQQIAHHHRDKDVLAYMSDPWALEMLIRADHDRLRPFSYAGSVARQVMLAHPPYLLARRMDAPAQHILIIGFGGVGQALAREFAVTSISASPAPMLVTAIDPAMEEAAKDFRARYPALGDAIDIKLVQGNAMRDDADTIAAIRARAEISAICAVYVVIDDANLPLSNAVALRERAQRLGLFSAPIFLCSQHGAGLPAVRHGAGLVGAAANWEQLQAVEERATTEGRICDLKLVSFGSWGDCADGAGLLAEDSDGPAMAFHNAYLAAHGGDALSGPPRPAAQPWQRLSEQFRASNRRAAAHIRAKSDAAGFNLDGWLDESAEGWATHVLPPARDAFLLDDASFMLRMGELEHRRWMAERLLEGWSRGPRDNRAKLHPDLRPFSELGPEAIGKDDTMIRTTAGMLHGADKRRRKKKAG